jgi:hypothetical protein
MGRAILVSVDGLGAIYLRAQLDKGGLPVFAALLRSGASTMNARADFDYTETLPDHVTILTGRPVEADPDLPDDTYHGWTVNGLVDFSVTLHNGGNPHLVYIASIFDVVHDHGGRTCMYSGKPKFTLFSNSYSAANGAPDQVGRDDGRNKIDHVVILEDTSLLMDTAEGDLQGGACDFALVHISDLDRVGHDAGWGSSAWMSTLTQVDGWVGRLAKFADASLSRAPFAFVLTADHGGNDTNHTDPTDYFDYTIPFLAIGRGITPNSDFYALAAGRRTDPGGGRPRNAGPAQPVRNGDAANAVLSLMGLSPVPGSYFRGLLEQP